MISTRATVIIFLLLAIVFVAVYRWGPVENGPQSRPGSPTTAVNGRTP